MLHFLHLRNSALLHSENIAFHVANLQRLLFTTSYKRDKEIRGKKENGPMIPMYHEPFISSSMYVKRRRLELPRHN